MNNSDNTVMNVPSQDNNPAPKAGKGKKAAKSFAILIVTAAVLFGLSLLAAFPRSGEFVVELGEDVPVSPSDYLLGYDFIVSNGKIDASGVDTGRVGDYKANASLLFYNYSLIIRVVDTTPPEIIPFSDELFIATGRDYKPEDFAESISDISGDVSCVIKYGGSAWESISFPIASSYRLTLEAADNSGNVASREIAFTAD